MRRWQYPKWIWPSSVKRKRRVVRRQKLELDASLSEKLASADRPFRDWESFTGERFADLKTISQPTLVVNGVRDEMIPVRNSYWMAENLANAVLMTYPDAGHGSLFQYYDSFTRQTAAFLSSDSTSAPY